VGAASTDPLASPTLAGLYASQGDAAAADAILRQITPEETGPASEEAPPAKPAPAASYLTELGRLRQVAERLRKAQSR
jgi:hypothetical protein